MHSGGRKRKQKPFMIPGRMYMLRGLQKNGFDKCMAVGSSGQLITCQERGWPFGKRRYTDGDVFVCLSMETNPHRHYRYGQRQHYKVLTPGGEVASLTSDRNKTKFREVKR